MGDSRKVSRHIIAHKWAPTSGKIREAKFRDSSLPPSAQKKARMMAA